MSNFTVKLTDSTTAGVANADCYTQEGPMTTFFAFGENRATVDSWSRRVASFRTTDITSVVRVEEIARTDRVVVDLAAAG